MIRTFVKETGQKHEAEVQSVAKEVLQNVSVELLSVDQLICSDKYEPLCATDGRTYKNGCHLDRHNASIKFTNESAPLRNLCEFSRQRCLAERTTAQNLTVISYRNCDDNNISNDNITNLLIKSQT
uniref:Kazal-like domain-containing protein n=1 Tax=Meloidogyne hapla TaxID=6305 RepID=A0A1I8BXZ6_MELHA